MKKMITFLLAVCLLSVLIGGCAREEKTDIAATTLPVYEFTSRLCAGTPLQVSRLVTESVSCLHDYSLKVSQMRIISSAHMVTLSGGGLEGFLHDALHSAQLTVDASQGIDLICSEGHHHHGQPEDVHEEPGHHHEHDPHFWLDPRCAQIMAGNICRALSREYPGYQEIFQENLKALNRDLEALYHYGQEQLASLACRDLITFHDGFAYFARAFDLHILTSVEEEPGSETSAAHLKHMILMVQEHQLPAIFVEKNGSSASASVIAAETGAKVFALDMAMSGNSYFDSMYHNIDTIKEALG